MANIIEILKQRGYIEQLTHEKEIEELLSKPGVPFYIGLTQLQIVCM